MPTATRLWDEVVGTLAAPGTLSLWWLYQARLLQKVARRHHASYRPLPVRRLLASWAGPGRARAH